MEMNGVREPTVAARPASLDFLWANRAGWVIGLVLSALLTVLYWPVLVGLVQQWSTDSNYSHGFLIPLISAYLVWERWDQLRATPVQPNWSGLGFLLVGFGLLIAGQLGAELFLQRSSLILAIAGLVSMTTGPARLCVLRFPIAFLLFMIPVPAVVFNAIAFPLQTFAAQTAASCLAILEIPVLREGHIIMLARTSLEVAEACSGIRSLMSLLALGTVFAYFTQRVAWKRWCLVASAVPVAIAANAFRVAGTGVLAHYIGEETAQGFYHDFSGWLVFVVALLLLFAIGRLLNALPWRTS